MEKVKQNVFANFIVCYRGIKRFSFFFFFFKFHFALEQDFSAVGAKNNGGWCLNTLENKEVLREKRVPPQYILFLIVALHQTMLKTLVGIKEKELKF